MLDSWWSQWFSDMELIAAEEPNDQQNETRGTVMRGSLPDQAALFGLLGRVRDLNLTLLEVRRIDKE